LAIGEEFKENQISAHARDCGALFWWQQLFPSQSRQMAPLNPDLLFNAWSAQLDTLDWSSVSEQYVLSESRFFLTLSVQSPY
jgi:hypothetical protein